MHPLFRNVSYNFNPWHHHVYRDDDRVHQLSRITIAVRDFFLTCAAVAGIAFALTGAPEALLGCIVFGAITVGLFCPCSLDIPHIAGRSFRSPSTYFGGGYAARPTVVHVHSHTPPTGYGAPQPQRPMVVNVHSNPTPTGYGTSSQPHRPTTYAAPPTRTTPPPTRPTHGHAPQPQTQRQADHYPVGQRAAPPVQQPASHPQTPVDPQHYPVGRRESADQGSSPAHYGVGTRRTK